MTNEDGAAEFAGQFQLVCTKCHKLHDIGVQNNWGAHPGTQGLGPRVVCPALVESSTGSRAVCRGLLVAHTV